MLLSLEAHLSASIINLDILEDVTPGLMAALGPMVANDSWTSTVHLLRIGADKANAKSLLWSWFERCEPGHLPDHNIESLVVGLYIMDPLPIGNSSEMYLYYTKHASEFIQLQTFYFTWNSEHERSHTCKGSRWILHHQATLPSSWTPIQLWTACWWICINLRVSKLAWLKAASPSGNSLPCPQAGLVLKWKLECEHDLYTTVLPLCWQMLLQPPPSPWQSVTGFARVSGIQVWELGPPSPLGHDVHHPSISRSFCGGHLVRKDYSPDPEPPLLL